MALLLIQMKLALLRRLMTGSRAGWMVTGGVVGLLAAAATLVLSVASFDSPTVLPDLLALVFAFWAIVWVVVPVWFGGGGILKPSYFTMLPIHRRQLALGLLGAALVSVTAAVTLIAFASLPVYAGRLGGGPLLVAIPALALQFALVVVMSQLALRLFGSAAESRLGAGLTGVIFAALLVVAQSGWMVFVAVSASDVLTTGFSNGFSVAVRALPSSWGLVAVDAADSGDWLLAVLAIAGLAVLTVAMLIWWGRLLDSPGTERATVRGSSGRVAWMQASVLRPMLGQGVSAVVVKELRSWWRDSLRIFGVVVAVSWALITCLFPLSFGATLLLPWAGAGIAVMATTVCVNMYGQDGTALWMSLMTPGTARDDVRGRQLAWLAVFAPITVVTTVVLTAVSGQGWAWPWVLALAPALIGGGAGLFIWASVAALAPGPNPYLRRNSPMDQGDSGGMAFAMFWIALLPAVPAAGLVAAGTLLDSAALTWAGVPTGIVTGIFLAWWLGRVAYRRLEERGPELLSLMRTGKPAGTRAAGAQSNPMDTMPWWKKIFISIVAPVLGSLALFPQGLVPLIFKLTGNEETRVWFLALYMEPEWQWPVIAGMIALGLSLYAVALCLYRSQKIKDQQGHAANVLQS